MKTILTFILGCLVVALKMLIKSVCIWLICLMAFSNVITISFIQTVSIVAIIDLLFNPKSICIGGTRRDV